MNIRAEDVEDEEKKDISLIGRKEGDVTGNITN